MARRDLHVIKYACYESTILNSRRLVEFYGYSTRWEDDLRASKTGYRSTLEWDSETISFVNKCIAHLTDKFSDYEGYIFPFSQLTTTLFLEPDQFINFMMSKFEWSDDDLAELRSIKGALGEFRAIIVQVTKEDVRVD